MKKSILLTLLTVALLFVNCKIFNKEVEVEIEGQIFITTEVDENVEIPESSIIAFFPKTRLLEAAEEYAIQNSTELSKYSTHKLKTGLLTHFLLVGDEPLKHLIFSRIN